MTTMNVLDSAGSVVAIEKPLTPGRAAAASSRPVALSNEDLAALTATAAVTVAAGAATIAKAEDVASADADVGVPAMAVRKATPANTSGTDGDYEMLQMSAGRLWVDPSGVTLTVAAHAVTLAAGAAAIAKAEDVASADADVGVPAMAVRKASPANTSGTDGDYEMLQISAGRLWASAVIDTALPAGTALIGRAAADASAATGGIASTARLLSAAGTSGDATNVKASAGRLYAIQGYNAAAAVRYLKLYNSASAPTAGSGTPVKTLVLPPACGFTFDWPLGYTFSTGIGFTLVTGSADNSSTSVTAADILGLNLDYV
jgi:hypothetical protein